MNPQKGDLMFTYNQYSLLARTIAFYTRCKISHVQLVLDIGENGTIHVITAEAEGLVEKWIVPQILDWYCILTCPDWSKEDREKICQWQIDGLGTPYDVLGLMSFIFSKDLNSESRLFCSEVCYLAPIEAIGYYLLDGVDHAFIQPRDLYITPLLKTLDGKVKEIR